MAISKVDVLLRQSAVAAAFYAEAVKVIDQKLLEYLPGKPVAVSVEDLKWHQDLTTDHGHHIRRYVAQIIILAYTEKSWTVGFDGMRFRFA